MRAAALLILVALLAPTAAAGVPFEIELRDFAGDTRDTRGRPAEAPSADILNFTSAVVEGKVVQRVEVAATPQPPYDWILVRSWFANSTNGSFHAIDIEVTPEPEVAQNWVEAIIRDGDFHATRAVPVAWRIENATWVFEFDAALVANATCFDPGIFTRGHGGEDGVYPPRRRCEQAPEPVPPPTPVVPRINATVIGGPTRETAPPTVEAPGSRTPTPGIGALALVAVVLVVAFARRR